MLLKIADQGKNKYRQETLTISLSSTLKLMFSLGSDESCSTVEIDFHSVFFLSSFVHNLDKRPDTEVKQKNKNKKNT